MSVMSTERWNPCQIAVTGVGTLALVSWTFRNPLERFTRRHPILSSLFRLAPGGLPALISAGSVLMTLATLHFTHSERVVYCRGYLSGKERERRALDKKRDMIREGPLPSAPDKEATDRHEHVTTTRHA